MSVSCLRKIGLIYFRKLDIFFRKWNEKDGEKRFSVVSDAAKLKHQEVIDALIDGHETGIAKYLGPKRKEDKP